MKNILYAITGQLLMFATGILFYGNIIPAFAISFTGYLLPSIIKKRKTKKRKEQLMLEFRDVLRSISSSLLAGQSVENAFRNSVKDLELVSPFRDSEMKIELKAIVGKLNSNVPIRHAIYDFAKKTDIEDIRDFADAFLVCHQTGADFTRVVSETCDTISTRFDMSVEININTAKQRLSQRILGIMPFFLTGFMMISWPEYLSPLHTPFGNIIITFVLLLLAAAFYLGEKIIDIKI